MPKTTQTYRARQRHSHRPEALASFSRVTKEDLALAQGEQVRRVVLEEQASGVGFI